MAALSWPSVLLVSTVGTLILARIASLYSVNFSYISLFLATFTSSIILGFLYDAVFYPRLLSPLRKLPQPTGNSFFMGQFGRILNEPTGVPQIDWVSDIPNDGLIYYRSLFNIERVVPTTPQALAEILSHKSYEFIKPKQLRAGLGRILGVGLVLAEGDEHRVQRKNLMPAFSFRHVKDLYPIFWSKSCHLVRNLGAEITEKMSSDPSKPFAVVEIANWASRATLDIIGVAGLGKDFNALDDPETELNRTYRSVLQPNRVAQYLAFLSLVVPQQIVQALPFAHNNNIVEGSKAIKRVARQLIQDKKEKMRVEGKRRDVDILSVSIESGGFSDEDMVNQLMTFLAAGHETTATALTWAIYLLCKHPEIQSRLREDIRATLPSPDAEQDLSDSALDSCTYLHAVCSEVLRLYAPVPITLREAAKDTSLAGHFIPKGTAVMICVWAINTSTAMWGSDAKEFNPDRWIGPGRAGSGGAESNYAFLTFLHGPRSCIGQQFAKAEFACLVAALVGRFDFELEDDKMEIRVKGGITARPKDGLKVKMKALEGW